MSVHPDFQAILDMVNSLPATDYSRPPLELAQEMRSAPVRIPPLPNAVAVEVRKVSGSDGHAIPVRIYRPESPAPHAVLVSMHGGGWVRGSLDGDEFRSHFMAHESGCAVVSVDYRLAPEHPYPAALNDCLAVIEWVAREAAALGFDKQRIGVAGDSAGANLATAVALKLRDGSGPLLKCQILVYPVCDHDFDRPSYLANAEGKLLTRQFMMWCWDQYAGGADRNLPYLSPLRAGDLSGMPPTLLLTAEYDPLRDEGEAYARALQQAGNLVKAERLDGMVHPFQSLAPQHPCSIESFKAAASFAKAHLNPT
ncbi:alpha/beta hydrolase [Sphingopyxis flava]|uniref:Acetyl esterase n=1 Tax=Sphingopyxis flava TaxID=1507287 RepID=A0A1T5G5T6_9SPHN|nr:alpha/beta hydrolase [Sphingopyxis flava]SKC03810.1 acetyl esterase [Sphingopyxis flava]